MHFANKLYCKSALFEIYLNWNFFLKKLGQTLKIKSETLTSITIVRKVEKNSRNSRRKFNEKDPERKRAKNNRVDFLSGLSLLL